MYTHVYTCRERERERERGRERENERKRENERYKRDIWRWERMYTDGEKQTHIKKET